MEELEEPVESPVPFTGVEIAKPIAEFQSKVLQLNLSHRSLLHRRILQLNCPQHSDIMMVIILRWVKISLPVKSMMIEIHTVAKSIITMMRVMKVGAAPIGLNGLRYIFIIL
jgi:hypothetical protein